jgi:hypothetical protein
MSAWRRPITVWFLFVFFLWAVGKDFQLMVTHKSSVDYFIFESHNLLQLFFLFMTVTFILDFAGSYFLLRPSKAGFWVCLSAIGVGLINNVTALYLALSNLSGVREAYALSRELRGLPAREANLDRIFTPEGMQAGFAIASLFAVVAAALILLNRRYFYGPKQETEDAHET